MSEAESDSAYDATSASGGGLTARGILGPGGRIAQRLPNYEPRPQQLAMAEAVAKAMQNRRHLVVEAGTGVGKSFAYLVPAILASAEAREDDEDAIRRVVISTHTIALQEQLLKKDIPFLNAVIPLEFTAVLAKGRGNYISLRRLHNAIPKSRTLIETEDGPEQIRRIAAWAEETRDGSLSELPFRPSPDVWQEVQSDHGNCMGRQCPSHMDCFFYAARRRVAHAQIIIVNHALFFSDLALRRAGASLLPNYDAVIFDEAHTLEQAAGDHLGLRLTSGQVDFTLSRLYNDRSQKGLLVSLGWRDCQERVQRCHLYAQDLFDDVRGWMERRSNADAVRVFEPNMVDNRLSPALDELSQRLRLRAQELDTAEQRQDALAAADRLSVLSTQAHAWLSQTATDYVYWVDRSGGKRRQVSLEAAPLELGPTLHQALFQQTRSVILTSATLAVGDEGGNGAGGNGAGSFDFFRERVGLANCDSLRLGSPFDYAKQARLVLVQGLPDPSREPQPFEHACFAALQHYIAQTQGRAFVLFTSYSMLRNAAAALMPWLVRENLELISQADGVARGQMLRRFQETPRSVLFGADSFWQGVDVPGDALQNVIIPKLPFSVPDRPLLAARLEAIRIRGGNPFMEYQVPEAVIRLKQGFGRLIRTATDRGQVVILDPRITTKPYGRMFLKSLPPCQVVREPFPPPSAARPPYREAPRP